MNVQEQFIDFLMSLESIMPKDEREEISKLIAKTGPGVPLNVNGNSVSVPTSEDVMILGKILDKVKRHSRKKESASDFMENFIKKGSNTLMELFAEGQK